MAQDISTLPAPFDYEFLVDHEHLRTVTASSSSTATDPWIEPERLKLRHRIGRGPFGDVWLATHHQSTEDYDEYHEVAAKMLPPIREEHMKTALEKFCELYFQCQGVASVCWLLGISILNGRVGSCILFSIWEILNLLGETLIISYIANIVVMLTDMHHYEFLRGFNW